MSKWIKGAPAEAGWYWFRGADWRKDISPYFFDGAQLLVDKELGIEGFPSNWEHHIDMIQWPE
jgi:hypothetical protein